MTRIDQETRRYLARIGSKGGKKSRRRLTPEQAREMVRVREARRAYRRFHARCFGSCDPDYEITKADVPWVAERLERQGDREAREIGAKLSGGGSSRNEAFSSDGVDLTAIRWMLRRSPEERLQAAQDLASGVLALRAPEAGEPPRG